jgi:peptidoglycan/LPS O-acetylase OafA/YrhL
MRNKRLDVLRGVAILLVLLRHGAYQTRLTTAGWVGVDLFFVLSGFLISGLLFSEYIKRGSINFKRFLIRRGMKIYPAFYVLLAVTFAHQVLRHELSSLGRWLAEIFYLQNYGTPIWGPTWSLAVEEQFYILLPLFFLILIRYSSHRANPFRVMPYAFVIVAIASFTLRVVPVLRVTEAQLQNPSICNGPYGATQCRLDGLFFGVLLGYLHHFRPEILENLVRRPSSRVMWIVISAILVSSCLMFAMPSRMILTVGLTALYLGFGIILILCLRVRGVLPRGLAKALGMLGTGFAVVGVYSYSIYLWHAPVDVWGMGLLWRVFHRQLGGMSATTVYIVASCAFGILMSKLVEFPILRLRDRVFPGSGLESLNTTAAGGS